MLLETGTNSLIQCRVATNLQFVKNVISTKCNKAKPNTMRYACKKHQEWKRQCKTIFAGDMTLYTENPKESTKKL